MLEPAFNNLPVPLQISQSSALAGRAGSSSASQGYRSAPATRATFQLGSSRSIGCSSDGASHCSSRNCPSGRRRIAPPRSAKSGRARSLLPVMSGRSSSPRAVTSEAILAAIDAGISTDPSKTVVAPSNAWRSAAGESKVQRRRCCPQYLARQLQRFVRGQAHDVRTSRAQTASRPPGARPRR